MGTKVERLFPAWTLAVEAADAARLAGGDLADPQRVLGPHQVSLDGCPGVVVRAYHADAIAASLVLADFDVVPMQPAGTRGLFACFLPDAAMPLRYRLRLHFANGDIWERGDPYRFPPAWVTSISICSAREPTGDFGTSGCATRAVLTG